VTSIGLGWFEFKTYAATIGPGVGRPDRPRACPFCDGARVWFDGWRLVSSIVFADGKTHRFDDGLWLQRTVCAACDRSWTLLPSFLYPSRFFEPDVVEAAGFSYLSESGATYEKVGQAFGCSASTVWRWVGWIAGLLAARPLLAEAERLSGAGQSAALMPREVPQRHAKAYSAQRGRALLDAFQGLCALLAWSRAQPTPPMDPSPLRFWLAERFQAFREVHRLTPANSSPPLEGRATGPPAT
jgi:hypothetical protein